MAFSISEQLQIVYFYNASSFGFVPEASHEVAEMAGDFSQQHFLFRLNEARSVRI
jgi:hypothetical protein